MEKEIAELKDEVLMQKKNFPQTTQTDEHKEISRLKISGVNDLKAIRVSWKSKHKIRGDRWRPDKNPLMVKSVFLEFQV